MISIFSHIILPLADTLQITFKLLVKCFLLGLCHNIIKVFYSESNNNELWYFMYHFYYALKAQTHNIITLASFWIIGFNQGRKWRKRRQVPIHLKSCHSMYIAYAYPIPFGPVKYMHPYNINTCIMEIRPYENVSRYTIGLILKRVQSIFL